MIIDAFKNGIFPLAKQPPSNMSDWKEDENRFITTFAWKIPHFIIITSTWRKAKSIVSEINRQVIEKNKIISKQLLKKYFGFQDLISMQKELYKTKNTGKKINW